MKQEFSPYFVIYMDLSLGFVTWICHLDLSELKLIVSCDGCHACRPVATMRQMRQLPHLKFPKKICLR